MLVQNCETQLHMLSVFLQGYLEALLCGVFTPESPDIPHDSYTGRMIWEGLSTQNSFIRGRGRKQSPQRVSFAPGHLPFILHFSLVPKAPEIRQMGKCLFDGLLNPSEDLHTRMRCSGNVVENWLGGTSLRKNRQW